MRKEIQRVSGIVPLWVDFALRLLAISWPADSFVGIFAYSINHISFESQRCICRDKAIEGDAYIWLLLLWHGKYTCGQTTADKESISCSIKTVLLSNGSVHCWALAALSSKTAQLCWRLVSMKTNSCILQSIMTLVFDCALDFIKAMEVLVQKCQRISPKISISCCFSYQEDKTRML